MQPVQLFCWHFMAYPYLDKDFDKSGHSGWVTTPNKLWDNNQARGLYQEYIDQLALADELGFDGMVLNEHHQNIYGLMPSPNIIASALTQRSSRGKIVILGNLLPLHLNPMRVAEEYAMLDQMSNGRLIAGFAPGGGPETFNYDIPSANTREKFWEAADLIVRSWTDDGPFAHEGRYYPLRYVNLWPKPLQKPYPPVWIPGSRSPSTMIEVAKRGYCYFLSSRSHGGETHRAQQEFAKVLEDHGDKYHPFRFGILMSVYVADTDQQARAGMRRGRLVFLEELFEGPPAQRRPPAHLRSRRALHPRRRLARVYERLQAGTQAPGRRGKLGRVGSFAIDHRRQSGDRRPARIRALIERAKVGNLLIQFQFGNMPDHLARKNMKLFAEKVAPVLRHDSAKQFTREFPGINIEQSAQAVQ